MGQRPRPKPKKLAAKLFAIRQRLGLSQSQMAYFLKYKVNAARVSEYEKGTREPSLLVLLNYAHAANISMESLANDKIELPEITEN